MKSDDGAKPLLVRRVFPATSLVSVCLLLVAIVMWVTPAKSDDGGGTCDVTIYQAFAKRDTSDEFVEPVNTSACIDPARRKLALSAVPLAGAVGALLVRRRR